MKISKVTIKNYKSIEELTIDLSEEAGSYLKILAGINEAGKSNILNGLAMLGNKSTITYSKVANRKARKDRKPIEIIYELDDTACQPLIDSLVGKGLPEEVASTVKITSVERRVQIDEASKRIDFFYVYTEDGSKIDDYEFSPTTATFVKLVEGAESSADAIHPSDKETLEELIEKHFADDALEANLPNVVFWKYKDQYLINEPIALATFSADSINTSRPLHNVFNLAGYTDAQIPAVITEALADGGLMGEMQDALSGAITTYLATVWPEHKVDIKVHTNSETIEFHVTEKENGSTTRYGVHERSDGFKHFFAILLNLAVENTTKQLKDCLVVLDEPEVHLHPSGAKFLRDELLKIGQNNTLVYSTHSIFMIDKKCLNRHYKVYKEKEVTNLLQIDDTNPFKEELIYEALGTSVLDLISEHNILFEGLTDKKLFDAFTVKFKTTLKPLSINTITVDSEQHFEQYCQFFNKNNIKGYILADSDREGVAAKKRIIDSKPNYDETNTYVINDILDTGKESCLEDLLPIDILQDCIKEFAGVSIALDATKTLKTQLADYNKANKANAIDTQKLKMSICDYVCTDITKRGMTLEKTKEKYGTYCEFVEKLHDKIKSLEPKAKAKKKA